MMKTCASTTRLARSSVRAAALATVLVLAACGSDDPAPAAPGPGPGLGAMMGDLPDSAVGSSAALIAYLKDWEKSETGAPVDLTTTVLPTDDTSAAIDI